MPKKTTTKTRPAAAQQTVKFTKGGYYQDLGGDLWFCTNAKQKKVGDDSVVMMQATEDGQPVGDATDRSVRSFNKQLTAAELKEYQAVCEREREAEGEQGSEAARKTGKSKTKKADKAKPTAKQPGKMSALDAAAKVLGESKEPMATKAMIEAMSLPGRDPLRNNTRLFRGHRFDATCFRIVSSDFPRTGYGVVERKGPSSNSRATG